MQGLFPLILDGLDMLTNNIKGEDVVNLFNKVFGKSAAHSEVSKKAQPRHAQSLVVRSGGAPTSSPGNDVVRGKICWNTSVVLTGGVASFICSDGTMGSETLLELGRVFRYYRFNRILVHLPAPNWTTAVFMCVAYHPAASVTLGTYTSVETEHQVMYGMNTTTPTELVVPSKSINPQHGWFLTTGDATEPNADIVGILQFIGQSSSTETIEFSLSVEYEFCCLTDPTSIGPVLQDWVLQSKQRSADRALIMTQANNAKKIASKGSDDRFHASGKHNDDSKQDDTCTCELVCDCCSTNVPRCKSVREATFRPSGMKFHGTLQ